MSSKQTGLDNRHRDANGQISRKHRNTLIGTLRQTYGANFAPGYADDATLGALLDREGVDSLTQFLNQD